MEELAARMTHREFVGWQRYAARKLLPTRRMHIMLAQLAKLIAQTMGNRPEATIEDFLLEPEDEAPEHLADDDIDVEEARAAFNFAPEP